MPVPGGFGGTTLDYIGCAAGKFFAIETKKPGAKPTDRQKQIIASIERAGGKTFVIDGDTTELEQWIKATTHDHTRIAEAPTGRGSPTT